MQALDVGETLQKLIELQQTDKGLDDLSKLIQGFQDELDLNKARMDALKGEIQDQKKHLEDLAKRRKTLEIEVGSCEGKISKYQNQLLEVKTNKEYDALKLEIEKCGEEKGKAEEKVLDCLFKEDEQKQKIQALTAQLAQEEKKASGEKEILLTKIQDCEKTVAGKKEERAKALEALPEDDAERYEAIRASGKKTAVAAVQEDRTCGGCHMNVPAQTMIEIERNLRLHYCACGRYLYVKD